MAITAFTKTPCSPPPKVKKSPACPDCGALECLCRPRFFAGQLLSEQDLNRLDQYIKKKNQLHNRNLHGWGVVNGLKVLCDPCGQIKVTQGYALSPCGDDIVVCEDTAVDICSLIKQCKQQDRDAIDCQPFSAPGSKGCDDLEEEWVLAIRYAEFPSRGITALRGGACSNGCACGKPGGSCQCQGNGNCGTSTGCGCANPGSCGCASNTAAGPALKPRQAPTECEPTIVCEGYQFDVFRKPQADDNNDDDDLKFGGEMAEMFECCINSLLDGIPTPPGEANVNNIETDRLAWHQWCCRTREVLVSNFARYPSTNCELLRATQTLSCPDIDAENFASLMLGVIYQLGLLFIEALFNCLCLSILPPAHEGTSDPRVPLATVKVRGNDCEIVSICNWTLCRKLVTTWPSMCYWWSVVPIGKLIRNALDELCCTGFSFGDINFSREAAGTASVELPADAVAGEPLIETSENLVNHGGSAKTKAAARLNPRFNLDKELGSITKFLGASLLRGGKTLDPGAFLNSISRFNLQTDQSGLDTIEQRNLPQFMLLNSLAKPLLKSTFSQPGGGPDIGSSLLEAMLASEVDSAGLTESQDIDANADLHKKVAAMETQLAQQQALIDTLQKQFAAPAAGSAKTKKTTKKAAGKYAASQQATAKKTSAKKTAAKTVGRKKTTSKKTAKKKVTKKKTAKKKAAKK